MIYNIKTQENSDYDSLPIGWKLFATQRQYMLIKPPKKINDITGIYILTSTGLFVALGETRHPTIPQHGAQPSPNIMITYQGAVE